MSMLELAGVSANEGTAAKLIEVDLRLGAGEIVAVSGEPGAGKSALLRCVAGDLGSTAGEIRLDGQLLGPGLRATERKGVAIVWQELALCEYMDVAGNLLLGHEQRREAARPNQFHVRAAQLLAEMEIPIHDTTELVGQLSGSQRRLLALAMALSREPRLLLIDEPTVDLGVADANLVERLLVAARRRGIAVLLATRDVGQMFRIADRIVILRQGRIVAELAPEQSHPDEVAAVLAGGSPDESARRQLTRLHGLADSLARTEPSSGLALILSALAAALGVEREDVKLLGPGELPNAIAAAQPGTVKVQDGDWMVPVRSSSVPGPDGGADDEPAATGHGGVTSAIVVSRPSLQAPTRDELDLLVLYAGYAAAAIERLEAEAAQRETSALRRARELQQQFLSRLSHELRTPLTAIRGYATSLAAPDVVWDRDSEQRFLERIGVESERLGRLVDGLLDFSAIEDGVLRLQPDWCDLPLVVEAAVDCLPAAWARQVLIVGHPPVIWADHDRMEQVFVNLIGNAMRHNPAGTTVTVSLAERGSDRVEVIVADDGPGFPEQMRTAPFDPSKQARSRTAGSGLGLSITRGIIEAHGGTIELAQTADGTRFVIQLPVEAAVGKSPIENRPVSATKHA